MASGATDLTALSALLIERKDDNEDADDEEAANSRRSVRSSTLETATPGEIGRKSKDIKVTELDKIKREINRSRRAVKVMTGEEAEKVMHSFSWDVYIRICLILANFKTFLAS